MRSLLFLMLLVGSFVPYTQAQLLLPNPIPIPQQADARPIPLFLGAPAVATPVSASAIPSNPFMSAASWSNIHNDSYMSDTYPTDGPLGNSPAILSSFLGSLTQSALPVVITFDADGRLVAGAIRADPAAGTAQVRLVLINPNTLATLAIFDLPAQTGSGGKHFRPAGAYFYNDSLDRIVIATAQRTILVVSHSNTSFNLDRTYDVSNTIPADDAFQSVQPDFSGRLWFATKGGMVGTMNMTTGEMLGVIQLADENIDNASAADETGGVYIASNHALYRFDANSAGAPTLTWRETYDAGNHTKAGQVDNGTGTTPTLMGADYITITDNAEPQMHVLVYRRAKTVSGARLVCAEPVFKPGNGSTENSLVATDRSIVVENNFGYKAIESTTHGSTTKPGLTRIDLDGGAGCHTVWTNDEVSIPSVVSKMSLANGLIYTYTKPKGPATTDAWYFTAVDFATGQTVFQRLAGTGLLYNNHYAGLYLGPNGTLYVGVLGGVVAMRDTH
jgi:hypothetical protein